MLRTSKPQLKLALYLDLLKVPVEELTSDEVELMYLLARDETIQAALDTNRRDLSSAG